MHDNLLLVKLTQCDVCFSLQINLDYYQPPLLKRASQDLLSPSGSFDSHSSFTSNKSSTNNNSNSAATAAAAKIAGTTKAVALSFRQPSTTAAGAAAAVPSGAAARVRAAGGPGRTGENAAAAKIYYDMSSEVAEMAARVLRRHNAS